MRIEIMTINCGIENQTKLFQADLPLRASYSLLQLIFNESVNRNKIFRTGPFLSEKIVMYSTFFLRNCNFIGLSRYECYLIGLTPITSTLWYVQAI